MNQTHKMKQVYIAIDSIFCFVWGLSLIELVVITFTNVNLIFSNVDNEIKALFSIAGLIYFGLKIFFYFHKSSGERKLQAQQIRTLIIENDNKEVEIKRKELENFMFGQALQEMPKNEFEESRKRLE